MLDKTLLHFVWIVTLENLVEEGNSVFRAGPSKLMKNRHKLVCSKLRSTIKHMLHWQKFHQFHLEKSQSMFCIVMLTKFAKLASIPEASDLKWHAFCWTDRINGLRIKSEMSRMSHMDGKRATKIMFN